MNNRQTLMLLAGFAVLTGVARLWMGGRLTEHEDGLRLHKKYWEEIWTTVQNLNQRRSKIVTSEEEGDIYSHFGEQAQRAQMGSVNVQTRSQPKRNFTDKRYTVEFESTAPRFSRQQIVTFLYNAEGQMTRMRCTNLALQPATGEQRLRSVPSGADRADTWRISKLEFTRRTPTTVDQ